MNNHEPERPLRIISALMTIGLVCMILFIVLGLCFGWLHWV